jgi:hypothetical protein
MQVDYYRSFIGQNFMQRAKLRRPADEASGYLAIQQISNPWHLVLPSRLQDHINIAV